MVRSSLALVPLLASHGSALCTSDPCCCPDVEGCDGNNALANWCRVSDVELKGKLFAQETADTKKNLADCLTGCELSSECLFATYEKSVCSWFQRGIEAHAEEKWVYVQTQDAVNVPKTFAPDAKGQVGLGAASDLAECKALFLDAVNEGKVNTNFGRWAPEAASDGYTFALADASSGKGNVQVKVAYKGPFKDESNSTLGSGASGCQKPDGSELVLTFSSDTVVRLETQPATNPSTWSYSTGGLLTLPPGKPPQSCFTTSDADATKEANQKSGLQTMDTDPSNCATTVDTAKTMAPYFIFEFEQWNKKQYALGPCDATGEAVPLIYLGRNGKEKTCGVDGVICGQWELQLTGSSAGLLTISVTDPDVSNCFGYNTPPPPPPPPPSPPSPPTPTPSSTCDYCDDYGLSCCGTGIHGFCYNEEYNECCHAPMWTPEFPVVVVCALGQGCEPGCTPFERETTSLAEVAESKPVGVGVSQEENPWLHECKGLNGTFAECPTGMSCCGEGRFTPACYFEEYNTCCQPEGSNFSVICGLHQGCAQTSNGVPFCVDEFEACRSCAGKFPSGYDRYLCHEYGSETCFHAPDPDSCKKVFGDSATFCYGTDPLTPGSSNSLDFDFELI